MHCGGERPSGKQLVKRRCQRTVRLTCFRVLVTVWDCTKRLLRVDVAVDHGPQETVAPASATPEKLFCPLLPVYSIPAGCVRRHS